MPDHGDDARTFGVRELNSVVSRVISVTFPEEVWVRGEIKGYARNRGREHAYFELVEKEPGANRISAALAVALLAWNRDTVAADLAGVPDLALEDDLEVRIRGKLDYFGRFGKLQFLMTGIDPDFTLGRMAANRDHILRRLADKGLLDANANVAVPGIPLEVGLVTARNSAACRDFVHELESSGYAFRIRLADVRVQGRDTDRSILQALRVLRQDPPDVIAIVRGGGSRADLTWFDSESLARMIASMPVPVLTGIGHEIDSSVVDRVAHTSFKTPTATAAALVRRVAGALERLEDRWRRIASAAAVRAAGADAGLQAMTERVDAAARAALEGSSRRLGEIEARIRACDPERVIARGFTITRAADGRLVRSVRDVSDGDRLVTQVGDGTLRSTIRAAVGDEHSADGVADRESL